MNNVGKRYLREVEALLPYDSKQKKHCMTELEISVDSILENNPSAALTDLYSALGQPQEIAESFLERTNPEQLSRKLSVKRKIAIGVISIVAILAITLSIIAFIFADDFHDYRSGYAVETYEKTTNDVPLPSPLTIN